MGLKSPESQHTTYCGEITFLNCQNEFFETFGSSSFLLNEKPNNSGPEECMTRVRDYAGICILDVFLAICREDYVGAEDVGSKRKSVHEICKIVSDLKQE